MGRLERNLLPLAVAFAVGACEPSEAGTNVYLIAQMAGEQPTSADLGTIVVVQSKGGKSLRLRTVSGALRFSTDGARVATSCVPATDDQPMYFTIFPDDVEALLYVDLLPAAPPQQKADAGDDLAITCPGEPLAKSVVPITTVRTNPSSSTGGGGDATGAGGKGGSEGAAGGMGGSAAQGSGGGN